MSSSAHVRRIGFALIAFALLGSLVAFEATTAPAPTPAASAPAATAPAATMIKGPSKGTAAAAKPIFTSKCIVCHKADGSGGVKLTGNPTPNWKDAKLWADPKHNDDFLRDCITNGKIKSGMVAWGKSGQLKPAQIEDMIAYIHTLSAAKKK